MRVLIEAREMMRRGHEVTLACTPGCPLWERATEAGLPCEPVVFGKKLRRSAVAATRRIIKQRGIEIVNTHSSGDGWSGAIAAKLSGVICVRTRHLSNPVRPNLLHQLLYGRLTDYILTTGEAVRQRMIDENGIDPKRIESVPTGVDVDLFDPARYERNAFRDEMKIGEDEFVWGMVAMIRRMKGHQVLAEAAAILLKAHPQTRFVIVGDIPSDSPVRADFEAKLAECGITDRFIMTGYRTDIASIMAGCDAIVLPSLASEGLPQSITQAMAMAKPVVGTDIGATPEVVLNGQTGYVVPPRDAEALAAAMEKVMSDPQGRAAMGANGRKLIVEKYGLNSMVDDVERVYERLLGSEAVER